MSNHEAGKKGEKASETYMITLGFIRADKKIRREAEEKYKKKGILIEGSGFDYIKASEMNDPLPTLYELKTAGANRKTEVGDDWKGLGFTYTQKEEYNARVLWEKYRFIFLDLKKQRHVFLSENDFLKDARARIYPTKSIFIKGLSQVSENIKEKKI